MDEKRGAQDTPWLVKYVEAVVEVGRGALDSPRQVKDGEDNVGVVEERGTQDTPWLVKYVGEDVVEVERGALDSPRQVK